MDGEREEEGAPVCTHAHAHTHMHTTDNRQQTTDNRQQTRHIAQRRHKAGTENAPILEQRQRTFQLPPPPERETPSERE